MRAATVLYRNLLTATRPGHFLRHWSRAAAVFGLLMLVQPHAARAAPQELVSSGVSSVVVGTPTSGDPTLLWTTAPTCANAPGDEILPALINRGSLFLPGSRPIFSFNPPRSLATCNPYRLLSEVVTDGDFLYYVDNQGNAGRATLWRRGRLANADDPSQFLVDLGGSFSNAELIVFGNFLFAILHRPATLDLIVEYDKTTGGLLNGNVEFAGPDELTNMQYDGRYLYWINGGALRRNDTTNGAKATVVTGPISTYFLEGYDEQCFPPACDPVSRVLYAQGNTLFEADTIGGRVSAEYTSADPNARITAITRDAINLFFIERRAVGGGFSREDRFYRLPVGLSVPTLIYGPVNNGGPGFDGFTTDYEWLYFRDRAAQKLLRLENNAAAILVYDLVVRGIEVSQGLQNSDNSLRLIEGKRTIVRFYAFSGRTGRDAPGVTAWLQGANQQGFLGTLEPVNAEGKLITVPINPERTKTAESFQFELPRHWTTGGNLNLTATVNPLGRVPEDNLADNTSFLDPILFAPSRRLHVGYLNFRYVLNGTSYGVPIDEFLASQSFMRRLYPLADPVGPFAGPGLRVTFGDVWDMALGAYVDRTDQFCVDRYEKPADRNMCASDRVHAQIAAMRRTGLIPAETVSYGNIPQAVAPMGLDYFTRGYASGRVGSGPSGDSNYAPHEIGHVLGRAHPSPGASVCGHSASDNDYPYALSWIDDSPALRTRYAGLNFADRLPGAITYLNSTSYFDTMSYCRPNWISDYTYNGIYDFLLNDPLGAPQAAAARGGQAAAIAGDWLIVAGTLDPPTRRGGFAIVQRTDSIMDATPPVAGGFTLELRGIGGALLASRGFTATPLDDQPGRVAFDVVVPFVPGTSQLRAVEDASGRTLATRRVSANAPVISDVLLVDAPDPVDAPVPVTWTASDPDGDALRFDVLASRDGGLTYRPIQLGIDGDGVELDTTLLGGGTNQLRVVVSDGVQTGFADSAPFIVTPRPPVPMITSPLDGFRADWGQLVSFEAEIQDLQDALIDDARITWENDYGVLGTGRLLQTDDLEVGTNLVTVTATNSLGAAGSASVTVVIGDPLAPLGPTLSVSPHAIAWHIADDATPAQVAQIDVVNAGAANLDFDVISDAPWVRIDSALEVVAASAPRTLIVSADPTLVPAGTTSQATLTFRSHSDPNDVIVVPVTLSRGNVFDRSGAEPASECPGDCNEDGAVTVDELVRGVNIALVAVPVAACSSLDANTDGAVTIDELTRAVNRGLNGCAAAIAF